MRRALLVLGMTSAGCAPRDPCDGSMLDSPGGLTVTAEEHGPAWGQPDCAGCHATAVLHRTGCTPGIDLSAVRAEVAAAPRGCPACHGANGVGGDSGGAP